MNSKALKTWTLSVYLAEFIPQVKGFYESKQIIGTDVANTRLLLGG